MRSLHSLRRMSGTVLALMLAAGLPLSAAQAQPAKPAPKGDQKPATPAPSEQFVDGIAAIVNKDVITLREVREASKLASADLQKRGIQVPDERTLQKQVLQRLIMERLERQEADRMGIRVDEAQVDQAINMIASRNKITPAAMRAEIEKSGVTWEQYRKSLRDDIRMDRLRQRAVDANIIISDAEVDAFLKDQERNPAAAQATRAPAPQQPQPQPRQPAQSGPAMLVLAQILVRVPEGSSPDQVAALRKKAEGLLARAKKGDDFASLAAANSDGPEALQGGMMGARPLDGWPDLFVKAAGSLSAGQVSGLVQSGNGFHILKVVDRVGGGQPAQAARPAPAPAPQQPSSFQEGPSVAAPQGPVRVTQTHARHILIKTSTVMTDDQARQRLEQIRERLQGGAVKFEDMARQYSQDSTAPQGGDLGWVNPGDTVPPFEAAMNALQPNEISPPVLSPFGWHLIQVLERREHDVSDEVQRMRARQLLFERRAVPAFEDWLEQLRSQAFIDNRLEKQERLEQNNR